MPAVFPRPNKSNFRKNLDAVVFFTCVCDPMFFPYIRALDCSLSMIILPLWYIFSLDHVRIGKNFLIYFSVILLPIMSMTRLVVYTDAFSFSILSYGVIVSFAFFQYFFLRYCITEYEFSISSALFLFLNFLFFLSLVYVISPKEYFYVRSFWTMSDNVINPDGSLTMHRFLGIFSDPNNAACLSFALGLFLMLNSSLSVSKSFLVAFQTGFVVLCTMSTTGLSLMIIVPTIIFLVKLVSFLFFSCSLRARSILFLFFVACFFMIIIFLAGNFEIIDLALERAFVNLNILSEGSSGSRISIWKNVFDFESMFKSVFIGMGAVYIRGTILAPHNGHFHLIYSYGFVFYIIFMCVFFNVRSFKEWKKALFLIPLFVGFTVNVGVYEPRWTGIFVLLVAAYAASFMKKENYS